MMIENDFKKKHLFLNNVSKCQIFEYLNTKLRKNLVQIKNSILFDFKTKFINYITNERLTYLILEKVTIIDNCSFDVSIAFLKLNIMKLLSLDIIVNLESFSTLSLTLYRLVTLKIIHLELINFPKKGLNELATALSNLNELEKLIVVSRNESQIRAIDFSPIFKDIHQLKYLRLILYHNLIGSTGIRNLAHQLSKLKNLTYIFLNLRHNNLIGNDVECLRYTFLSIKNTITNLGLSLSKNNINTTGFLNIFSTFPQLPNLKILRLYMNDLELNSEIKKHLFDCLILLGDQLNKLKLSLSNNLLNDQNITMLCLCLTKHSVLNKLNLDMSGNLIGSEGMIALSVALPILKNLLTLKLNFSVNKVDDNGFFKVINSISKLNLEKLVFDIRDQSNRLIIDKSRYESSLTHIKKYTVMI
jgi:hypothetical protein